MVWADFYVYFFMLYCMLLWVRTYQSVTMPIKVLLLYMLHYQKERKAFRYIYIPDHEIDYSTKKYCQSISHWLREFIIFQLKFLIKGVYGYVEYKECR